MPHADVTKIVFCGDFLRPSAAEFRPTQHENIRWLAQLLSVPVSMACGLPWQVVLWDNNWVNQEIFDTDLIASIYQSFWLEPSIHSWAQIYASDRLPSAVEVLFERIFAGSLVIGFELPPVLIHFFDRHGIDFIDVALSPIRFMDDLLLTLSTSNRAVFDALEPYGVLDALKRLQAGIVSSHVAKRNPKPPKPNSLLIIMQTKFDKSLIENGHFVEIMDHIDDLKAIAVDYSNVVIKQHPIEGQPETLDALSKLFPNSTLSTDNFYRLVSHPNMVGVAALSSSCVYEAGYFRKCQHFMKQCIGPHVPSIGNKFVDIDDAIITPDFWCDVLGAAGLTVSVKSGLRLPGKPNRFRLQLRSAWGYNQIDTDISATWTTL